MEYKYFTLDKNPKQFKRISIGEYSIELRIEWNTRSRAWYVLGYSGDEVVISNTKMIPRQLYAIDIDSNYDLPYMIAIVPKYTNYDWDTETTLVVMDNPLSNAVEGLTPDVGLIDRSLGTSSSTHSKTALKGTENKYLFDVVSISQDTGITIICSNANETFKTHNLPQGRWDFTINGLRTITNDTSAFISLMSDYGVSIENIGADEFLWVNNSNRELKIEGLYPYAAGYDFDVNLVSNDSVTVHSRDPNGWVNRFTVCLVPASSLIWTITSGEVSNDYQYVNFTGEKSIFESTAKLSTTQALVEKYKNGIDPYSATIVNELTGVSDWVLDAANNRIVYTDPNASNSCTLSQDCGGVDYYLFRRTPTVATYYTSADAACSAVASSFSQTLVGVDKSYDSQGRVDGAMCHTKTASGSFDRWGLDVITNPVYDPNATDEDREKTLPLDVVAQQVISNAEGGDTNAQVVTTAVANELIQNTTPDDLYGQFEANKQPK